MTLNILRHFPRIDDDSASTLDFSRTWNSIDSKTNLGNNPYIANGTNYQDFINNTSDDLIRNTLLSPSVNLEFDIEKFKLKIKSMNITTIISSPFLRCVETALIVAKLKNITNILIDFRLGEFNDDLIFFDGAYDTTKIWNTTKDFIIEKFPGNTIELNVINDAYTGNLAEDEIVYYTRTKQCYAELIKKYPGCLVVTHNLCLEWKDKNLKLKYGEFYTVDENDLRDTLQQLQVEPKDISNITNQLNQLEILEGGKNNYYYNKYKKYNKKLIQLKKELNKYLILHN